MQQRCSALTLGGSRRLTSDGLLQSFNKNIKFVNGDITKIADWDKIPSEINSIFHLGAINGTKFLKMTDREIIDSAGNLITSTLNDYNTYTQPSEEALEMVFAEDRPLKIINAYENKSAAILKLNNYIDTYLYVVKFLDGQISEYLREASEALNFYYTVEDERTGIKISFILIYIVVVTLLLFLSISIYRE